MAGTGPTPPRCSIRRLCALEASRRCWRHVVWLFAVRDDDGTVHRESHYCGDGSYTSITMTLQRRTRATHQSISGLGPVLIAAGIVCHISGL